MNNIQLQKLRNKIARYQKMILLMAIKIEEHGLEWTDTARKVLPRKEIETIQHYINNHYDFSQTDSWSED